MHANYEVPVVKHLVNGGSSFLPPRALMQLDNRGRLSLFLEKFVGRSYLPD